MRRKLLAFLMAMSILLALGIPTGAVLAKSIKTKFTAQGALAQTSIGQLPQPILNKQGQPVGVSLTGEVFQGALGACTDQLGHICSVISGAPMTAIQNATLHFVGVPNPLTGTFDFQGKVDGTFTIGTGANYVKGKYEGVVQGTLTPLPPPYPAGAMLLVDDNNSKWEITKAAEHSMVWMGLQAK